MAIFAISDLHLALSEDKPMEVFGGSWDNYMERIKENWENTVKESDTVLIPGDISWAMYIKNAYRDFNFLNSLPGTKIISKGNHDYWWETVSKLNNFANENDFSTIKFMHNNAYSAENVAFCGSRGYPVTTSNVNTLSEEESKIYNRELSRFELSASFAKKEKCEKIVALLHYPPGTDSEFTQIMKEYGISTCIYGHLHGISHKTAVEGEIDGIFYKLVSCDFMNFTPYKLF